MIVQLIHFQQIHVLFYFHLNITIYDQNHGFFTKLAISLFLAKFACANLAAKFSLLNSGVVIYLLWSGILFLTAVRAVLASNLVVSGILSSISLILALYTSFLLHRLIYLNQEEQVLTY